MTADELPKFHEFLTPLLEVLKAQGELSRQDAYDAVIAHVGLTEEEVAVAIHSDGSSVVKGRIGWAASYLKIANALVRP